ncbi:hypothetical protein CHELA1G11_11551 [Hyphomicrobiales bacterium]|nr:hypothetical protein CHELA1G11_11551 [Hyphomicrobiales bacterium]CAH1666970.1 hypothetical protein CHELA1G2_12758 [Hyphomicrobiales bacterium]
MYVFVFFAEHMLLSNFIGYAKRENIVDAFGIGPGTIAGWAVRPWRSGARADDPCQVLFAHDLAEFNGEAAIEMSDDLRTCAADDNRRADLRRDTGE